MASSSAEVPYNQQADNVLFGHNVIEKILDTCLGQDGKRYYQVKWRESWEPEERLMSACEEALQVFWKEYYANVEQEIRKQVTASKTLLTMPTSSELMTTNTLNSGNIADDNLNSCTDDNPTDITHTHNILTDAKLQSLLPPSVLSIATLTNTSATVNFVDSFPEQSSTVAYYAVEDNNEHNHDAEPLVTQLDISSQAEILTQIMSVAPELTSQPYVCEKERLQRTSTMIRADTMSTKKVGAPDANSKYHCDVCTRSFASKRNVQRHMLSHTGEKPWMCEFCFKRFRQKPHLEQHVNIHKGIKNSVCTICGKAFNHRSNLVTHMATHSTARPHQCEICGENFKLKHTLAKHLLVHTKQDMEKQHQCKFCKRCFRDKSYLAEHETIHQQKKPWHCDICNKSFSFKRRFQVHMEGHQSKDGGCEYVCHLCSKTFKSKAHLTKHAERHAAKSKRKKRRKKGKSLANNVNKEKCRSAVEGEGEVVITAGQLEEGETIGIDATIMDEEDEKEDGDGEIEQKFQQQQEDQKPQEQQQLQLQQQQQQQQQQHQEQEQQQQQQQLHDQHDQQQHDLQHQHEDESQRTDNQHVIHMDATNDHQDISTTTANMVVANMLNGLNMNDEATYVALAQLTQAAMDNPPCDDHGNIILMKYEDIHKDLEGIQHHQEHDPVGVDIGIGGLQMGSSHQGSLHVVLGGGSHSTEHEEYGGQHGGVSTLVLTAHDVHLPNMDEMEVNLNGAINNINS